jgi:hypothetical protein
MCEIWQTNVTIRCISSPPHHHTQRLLEYEPSEQWRETGDLSVLCMTSYHRQTQPSESLVRFSYAQRNLYLIYKSHSYFHRKMFILLLVRCHCPPMWPPALPLNLTYICIVPSKLSLGSAPYTNSLYSKNHSGVEIYEQKNALEWKTRIYKGNIMQRRSFFWQYSTEVQVPRWWRLCKAVDSEMLTCSMRECWLHCLWSFVWLDRMAIAGICICSRTSG